MVKLLGKKVNLFLFFGIISIIGLFISSEALASQLKLSLKDLGAPTDVQLRTVKTHRDLYFTKPENWKASPNSKINLFFQHSPALLPERSSLNILINDQIIETITLSKDNVEKTNLSVPIPPETLKDYNKLTFQVDQHYTYKCEDPFDPSLWTTVLDSTTVMLDYTKLEPKKDLAIYPYPFFDQLEYGTTVLQFVTPRGLSDKSLQSLAMVDASLAQHIGWRDMKAIISAPGEVKDTYNTIAVGTPEENSFINSLNLPVRVADLSQDQGLIALVAAPGNKTKSVLVVTGNSPEGVYTAANALTQLPTRDIFKGNFVIVDKNLPNDLAKLRDWPKYITSKEQTRFYELGLESKTVRGVTALPIKYNIGVMPDIMIPKAKKKESSINAKLKVVYSYSAHLEPLKSQLEVVFNGISLTSRGLNGKTPDGNDPDIQKLLDAENPQGIQLNNDLGENLAEVEVDIPSTLIQPYNTVEFRFHLKPVKYDICRFTTDEHIWGTIHDLTYFDLEPTGAYISTIIPNMDPVNDGGYPFTAYPDLQNTTFVLPDKYDLYDIYAMISTVSRLAKMTEPTRSVNVKAVTASSLTNDMKSSDHLIAIGNNETNSYIDGISADVHLIYKDKTKVLRDDNSPKAELAKFRDTPDLGIVEQILNPNNSNRVVMLVYGQTDKGLLNATSLFANNKKFSEIGSGNIVAVSEDTVNTARTVDRSEVKQLTQADIKRAATWNFWWNILKIFLIIVGILAILKIIFGAFLRGASGR